MRSDIRQNNQSVYPAPPTAATRMATRAARLRSGPCMNTRIPTTAPINNDCARVSVP